MKKNISFISLFICAFMLFGSMLPVNAATYDVYKAGETITKEMSNGKKVNFTVVKDEGINSKYVKVIANPSDLSQFGVTTSYSYNELTTAISDDEWTDMQTTLSTKLNTAWGSNVQVEKDASSQYKIKVLSLDEFNEFIDEYSKEKYGSTYSNLSSDTKPSVASAVKSILASQSFWVINLDSSNKLEYDRVVSGEFTITEMDDTAKANKINLTVTVYICKTPKTTKTCYYDSSTKKYYGSTGEEVTASEYKKQCSNPNTADNNNIIYLTIIGIGCVACIVILGRKIMVK